MAEQFPTPNPTQNLTIGKGILTVGVWDGSTPPDPGDFTDIGNSTSITMEPTREKLDHYSSRAGIRAKDRTAEIEAGYNINFTLDEMSMFNLAMFLRGSIVGDFVYANENIGRQFALKFTSDNTYGRNFEFTFHKVELAPDGGLSLIGEEWMSMSFSGEGLEDSANHPESRFFTTEYVDNIEPPTTTTVTE